MIRNKFTFFKIILGFCFIWILNQTKFSSENLCTTNSKPIDNPNIIFLMADDLRADILGCYENQYDLRAFTPNLDDLASKGTIFTEAFAQVPYCGPSRTSLLTSRKPDTTKVWTNQLELFWREQGGNFTTLPQYFKEHGYYTAAFGKVFHPTPFNITSGVTEFRGDDNKFSWSEPIDHSHFSLPQSDCRKKFKNIFCTEDSDESSHYPDLEVRKSALKFINEKLDDTLKPIFLGVGFIAPHEEFKFPSRFLDLYPNVTTPRYRKHTPSLPEIASFPFYQTWTYKDIKVHNVTYPFGVWPDEVSIKFRRHYLGATSFMDEQIGIILKALKARLTRNTIVIFTSDHGMHLGENGEWSKLTNTDISLRVPLIVSNLFTKTEKHRKITNIVQSLDILPTIVDLAELPPINTCPKVSSEILMCTDGKSLKNYLVNSDSISEEKYAFSQITRGSIKYRRDKLHLVNYMGYSLRSARYRYTEWVKFSNASGKADFEKVAAVELYDYSNDKYERRNLDQDEGYENLRKTLSKVLRNNI